MTMTVLDSLKQLAHALNEQVLGQQHLTDRMLIALLANGHLLVEGAPGLAKTRAIKCLAAGIDGDFHRVQFTPDLLPGDITGTDVFRPEDGSFVFQPGPLFHNMVLADEINRAPAKVQSALLEAMAERQISVGRHTWPLPDLFLVMATQNPIEQEGTYPLPEAQLDRFLMHLRIDYPDVGTERDILRIARREERGNGPVATGVSVSQPDIFAARRELLDLHMSDAVEHYIVHLIDRSRRRGADAGPGRWLDYGASPRGSIALDRCARAHAWLAGKDYVSPDDVQAVAHDVLRHRLILSFEAEAGGIDTDSVISELLQQVPVA